MFWVGSWRRIRVRNHERGIIFVFRSRSGSSLSGLPNDREVRWLRSFSAVGCGYSVLVCALAVSLEGIICSVIWLPLVLILSTVGRLAAGICCLIFRAPRDRNYCVVIVALLPVCDRAVGEIPSGRF
jgi:hypothetical protein